MYCLLNTKCCLWTTILKNVVFSGVVPHLENMEFTYTDYRLSLKGRMRCLETFKIQNMTAFVAPLIISNSKSFQIIYKVVDDYRITR
jgi:hypothetical protein